MLLSGEIPFSPNTLERVTTDNYRNSEHPHLLSVTHEDREASIDLTSELREDESLRQVFELFKWETTYDLVERSENEVSVIARVIMVERRAGNRAKALEIPDLEEPVRGIIESGLEMPFQFDVNRENGSWKIDELELPEILLPLLEMPGMVPDVES